MERRNLLQRISDGLLPDYITQILYRPFFKIYTTDINGWSIVHLVSGMINALFKFENPLLTHTYWELFQFVAGDNKFDMESLIDIVMDTTFFMIGYTIVIRR